MEAICKSTAGVKDRFRSETARAGSGKCRQRPRREYVRKGKSPDAVEAIAVRLQGSESGAAEPVRPGAQVRKGEQKLKCDRSGDRGANAAQAG